MARVESGAKIRGKDEGGFLETVKVVVQALLIALVVRTLLFQPFNIPSGSLVPTLLVGDYLFVSKYTYGYSKHSIPFSPPVFSGRVWASEPKRGDIAVFKLPKDNSTDSRDESSVGFVPFENFVGRAEIIFFSIDESSSAWRVWEWPHAVRWGRIFNQIR